MLPNNNSAPTNKRWFDPEKLRQLRENDFPNDFGHNCAAPLMSGFMGGMSVLDASTGNVAMSIFAAVSSALMVAFSNYYPNPNFPISKDDLERRPVSRLGKALDHIRIGIENQPIIAPVAGAAASATIALPAPNFVMLAGAITLATMLRYASQVGRAVLQNRIE